MDRKYITKQKVILNNDGSLIMTEMTEEMIDAAYELQAAAKKYKQVFEKKNGKKPTVWVMDNETGETIFISDSFNSQLIREHINL